MPNAASVALFSGDEVLLIKRARAPYAGYWTLPGGRRNPDESIEECARREIFEELGLRIEGLVPVSLSPAGISFLLQVFAARWQGNSPVPSDEIADWCWTSLTDVAMLSTTPGLTDILLLAESALNKS